MDGALEKLQFGLSNLRAYLTGQELRDALLSASKGSSTTAEMQRYLDCLSGNRLGEVSVEYSASIVLLYGIWERFVEETLIDYIEHINSIVPKFGSLPKRLLDDHVDRTAELLLARHQQKYEGIVDASLLINNLATCSPDSVNFRLNAIAFAHHGQNLRMDIVNDMFSGAGLSGFTQLIKNDLRFSNYLTSIGRDQLSSKANNVVFEEVNDLASRRNEISHGEQSQILSRDIIREYMDFIQELSIAMVSVLSVDCLRLVSKFYGAEMPDVISVINRRIICFPNTPAGGIAVGDGLIAETRSGQIFASPVQRLEVNKISVASISDLSTSPFGVEVSFSAKPNWKYKLVKKPP